MAIYDCFQFFNEEHILDIRLNVLNKSVDFFVIVESTSDHQGNQKKLNFDISQFKKFKDKIIYTVVDDTAEAIKKKHMWGESLVEQHQRNSIMKGLKKCHDNDLIILSDVDEIPNMEKLKKLDYAAVIITAPGRNVDFVSRNFAPKLGIPEDPVTGSAHCELIPYWSKILNKKELLANQISERGGKLYCTHKEDRVTIGGEAVTFLRGEIEI